MKTEYVELRGEQIKPFVKDIAKLRIEVFAEWPYIYDGSVAYEEKYLQTYVKTKNSFIILAKSDGVVVGASTAIWLQDADEDFQKPFIKQKIDVKTVCYFGESVVKKENRGSGFGSAFMAARENFARGISGVQLAAFCAVIRPDQHPRKAKDYHSPETLWQRKGFSKVPGMIAAFTWKDLGENVETEKQLQFWVKKLKET